MDVVCLPLSGGLFAKIDKADLPLAGTKRWRTCRVGRHVYAACDEWIDGKCRRTYLHRLLLGVSAASRPIVDHVDGDGLNNTRANLRCATFAQNAHNRASSETKYRGVFKANSGFIARAGKTYGGYFRSEIAAALAFDRLACRLYGDAARLNFPPPARGSIERRFLEVV